MATTTVADILEAARSRLNDADPSGGDIFDDAFLFGRGVGPFSLAYRRFFRAISLIRSQRVQREIYYLIPAYTSLLVPDAIGLTDLDEPQFMSERGNVSTVAITSVSAASPLAVSTATPHGRSTNDEVVVSGVGGTQSARGRFFVTVTGPSDLTLNGSVSDGEVGTGGVLSYSSERFETVIPRDEVPQRDPGQTLGEFVWEDNVFRFRGATTARQIWLTYWASGEPPTSTSSVIGIENAADILSCLTAMYAAQAKNWPNLYAMLKEEAFGASGQADGRGGLLYEFLTPQNLTRQGKNYRRKPFSANKGRIWPTILN